MTMLRRAQRVGRRFLNPVHVEVGGPGMIFRVLPHYLNNKEERTPKVPLGPFRTDPAVYAVAPAGGLRVTWMGHSSMLVEIDGVRVLIDPVWDERASPFRFMGPRRFFAPPLALAELPKLDAVLISHDHYDHLGQSTVERLVRLQPEVLWVTSLGVDAALRKFGVSADRIHALDWTESVAVGGLELMALPARHFSGRGLSNRFETLWSSWVLRGPDHRVYYGADSGLWEGFAQIAAEYGPFDLTMLEIGAFHELWKDIHLGPDGAAQVFAAMGGQGLLMPIHWGLFDLALHAWRQPIERLTTLAEQRGIALWSPQPGLPTEVVAGGAVYSGWWR